MASDIHGQHGVWDEVSLARRLRTVAKESAVRLAENAEGSPGRCNVEVIAGALEQILVEIANHLEHGRLSDPVCVSKSYDALLDLGVGPFVRLLGEIRNETLRELFADHPEVTAAAMRVLGAVQAVLDMIAAGHLGVNAPRINRVPEILATLGQMEVAVFRAAKDSRLLFINEAGARMLGAKYPKDVLGIPFARFYARAEDRRRFRESAASGGQVIGERFLALRLDGSTRWLETNFCMRFDEQGQPQGIEGFARDVTSWVETEERARQLDRLLAYERQRHLEDLEQQVRDRITALEKANLELQQLAAMKDRFLANVSHELRTPLVSGLGYVELILEGGMGRISKAAERGLTNSRRNLKGLLALIDDLLLTTSNDRSPLAAIQRSAFPLAPLVEESVAELRSRTRKPIRVAVDLPADLPPVYGDRKLVARVLVNLLSNAEKFTGDDALVEIAARRASLTHLEVKVADNGVGIPTEDRPMVFERFYRAPNAAANGARGAGLGLAIVGEILSYHGCSAWIEDRAGGGTVVGFQLPVEQLKEITDL